MASVIVVDDKDNEIGQCDKEVAHKQAIRHRAFSIFIFNTKGELLIQKRNPKKYHSGGLWSNSCCSHPEPGEKTDDAAYRRLGEEIGINCTLIEVFSFPYFTKVGEDIFEHEYDHVYSGISDADPILNQHEAVDYTWINATDLLLDMTAHEAKYTMWFKMIMNDSKYLELLNINPY